ncbi:hypothetical protein HPO96_08865 [Kribbella sandramycini]|uniref:Uncharacterized protein n=1 Tax=Kribbella sandramycini TaxID=60450 RepID=A0A7Y4NZU2_9ACTN|nr:DUF6790 family protein [Kribbella sandramycini]MBB6569819.1 hypothetical protein [Kribbella sandramycini]NOL40354.1 hypothetical protein [Kribbella sandramycini]
MNTTTYLAETSVPMIWLVLAVAGALIRTRHVTAPAEKLEIWQRWWAGAALGGGSLWMTISFFTVPGVMSEAIGFRQTPFEFEIGCANLCLAVLAFRAASAKASARERMTIGLGAGMFLWGADLGHLFQFFFRGNHAPGNTGGVLLYDLLIPAVMIALAAAAQRRTADAGTSYFRPVLNQPRV